MLRCGWRRGGSRSSGRQRAAAGAGGRRRLAPMAGAAFAAVEEAVRGQSTKGLWLGLEQRKDLRYGISSLYQNGAGRPLSSIMSTNGATKNDFINRLFFVK